MNIDKLTNLLAWAHCQDKPWHSEGVHAEAIRALWEYMEPLGVQRVLEVGSGGLPSAMSDLCVEHEIEYIGLDMLPGAHYEADMHDLPFEDSVVDLVVSRHSLEHALIPYLALSEMARVSREWVLIVLPADDPRCEESPGHLYVMTRQGWENVFARLGLTVENYSEFDITDEEDRPQMEWRWLLRTSGRGPNSYARSTSSLAATGTAG